MPRFGQRRVLRRVNGFGRRVRLGQALARLPIRLSQLITGPIRKESGLVKSVILEHLVHTYTANQNESSVGKLTRHQCSQRDTFLRYQKIGPVGHPSEADPQTERINRCIRRHAQSDRSDEPADIRP